MFGFAAAISEVSTSAWSSRYKNRKGCWILWTHCKEMVLDLDVMTPMLNWSTACALGNIYCVFLFHCMSVYLSLTFCLSLSPYIMLSMLASSPHPYLSLSLFLSLTSLPSCNAVSPNINLSVSLCLCLCLTVCLSLCLCLSLSVFFQMSDQLHRSEVVHVSVTELWTDGWSHGNSLSFLFYLPACEQSQDY